jgi:dethiobiotin synthetase
MKPIPRKFFVAGTDTDCGKTFVSCTLLHAAAKKGHSTIGMKPVAAGAGQTEQGLRNDDALRLQRAASVALSYEQVNPVCLPAAVSPHLAAAQAGKRLQVQRISGFCQGVLMKRADLTLIEGAGGWRVPLSDREFMSDLARALNLPVILVVGMKLGCLNHALLTAEAIVRDGLTIAGWVATQRDPLMALVAENLQTLQEALPFPCIGSIPFLADPDDLDQAATHVNLEALSL